MRIEQPDTRAVQWDCPWQGHQPDPRLVISNSKVPGLIGTRCAKCGCLVYEFMEASSIVGPGGEILPIAQADGADA